MQVPYRESAPVHRKGGSGIGQAITAGLADDGVNVVIIDGGPLDEDRRDC